MKRAVVSDDVVFVVVVVVGAVVGMTITVVADVFVIFATDENRYSEITRNVNHGRQRQTELIGRSRI